MTLKKALAIGAGAYFTAYALLSGCAILDIKKNSEIIYQNAPDNLIINEYSAKINGRKKKLALIGEHHCYTQKESKHATELIKEYKNVGLEGANKKAENKVFESIVNNFPGPNAYFYLNGSGRLDLESGILSYLHARNSRFYLESKNPIDSLNFLEKARILGKATLYNLAAPIRYFTEKNKALSGKDSKRIPKFSGRLSNREKEMSESIESILNKDNINSLAVFVGSSHLENIAHALEMKMKLEEKAE